MAPCSLVGGRVFFYPELGAVCSGEVLWRRQRLNNVVSVYPKFCSTSKFAAGINIHDRGMSEGLLVLLVYGKHCTGIFILHSFKIWAVREAHNPLCTLSYTTLYKSRLGDMFRLFTSHRQTFSCKNHSMKLTTAVRKKYLPL